MNDPYPPNRNYYVLWTSIIFLPKLSLNVGISMMTVFEQWNDNNQLFKFTISCGKFIGISIY